MPGVVKRVTFLLVSLANLYREQGKYAQAEPLYQRAKALLQQHLGPHHPDVTEILQDLARFYHMQQQTAKARSFYQQALTCANRRLDHTIQRRRQHGELIRSFYEIRGVNRQWC